MSVLLISLAYLAFEVGLSLQGPLLGISAAALSAALVMLPAAIFVLVVRQPSWNVDLAVSRAVVGALLTAPWSWPPTSSWSGPVVGCCPTAADSAGPLAVAVLALGVMPVRAWLQRRVERLVFGSASDAGELLGPARIRRGAGRDDRSILEGLVEGLRRSLRLSWVAVESTDGQTVDGGRDRGLDARGRDAPQPRPRGGHARGCPPRRASGSTCAPFAWSSRSRAWWRSHSTWPWSTPTWRRARSRLLDVRQEERRLIRRELHDSLGPSLAGVALALAAIDKTSTLEPDDAEAAVAAPGRAVAPGRRRPPDGTSAAAARPRGRPAR